jgi:hypothetical protein
MEGKEEKMKIRSKHNNLLNYFICDHRDLSPAYVRSCEKYLKEISSKRQAASVKPEDLHAANTISFKRHEKDIIKK